MISKVGFQLQISSLAYLLGKPVGIFFPRLNGRKSPNYQACKVDLLNTPRFPLTESNNEENSHNFFGETQRKAHWLVFFWGEAQWWFQLKMMIRCHFGGDFCRQKWCPALRSEAQPHSIGTMILSHLVLKQWRSLHCTKVRQSNWYQHQLLWWNVPQRTRQHLRFFQTMESHGPNNHLKQFYWGPAAPVKLVGGW